MTTPIAPWSRESFQDTGSRAAMTLIAYADGDVVGPDFTLRGRTPRGVPVDALDLRGHRHTDSPEWVDNWRTGALRNIAAQQGLPELDRLDRAPMCYSVKVELADPPDLTHLQLAWAAAQALAEAGAFAILDCYAFNWYTGAQVAALAPDRPFSVQDEVSLIAETEPSPGFGHPVHTRGMIKFGRPDLIAGVPAERIQETGAILNHLARMQADGHLLVPGQLLRFDDGRRTLTVEPYEPAGDVPDVVLANDGLLLRDR
ncbi:hypothetical protein Val02_51300 [Virgisporangium aliadipatigenens]|uniref:Uncharacterized protein n=1 Tax=Virgisporangium aliadipatigenens TaxID=741659 RepID=A0A8J3YMI1_9ACTN|nr:hypothetical protein [Virgisporangium aliadipatigenens]GIJ48244.1 hypothetical protein Val02_51300 [Virgisporangium aliadipatigenens]